MDERVNELKLLTLAFQIAMAQEGIDLKIEATDEATWFEQVIAVSVI